MSNAYRLELEDCGKPKIIRMRPDISIPLPVSNNSGDNDSRRDESSCSNQTNSLTMQQDSQALQNSNDFDKSVDAKLVVRVQKGDKRAFDLLVVKYQGRVASVVSRFIRDHHEIADVTQEAFIKAFRAIKSFRGDSAFYTWLYRIAINCAKNYLVAKGRRPPANDVELDDDMQAANGGHLKDIATPESLLHKDQLEEVVHHAISELPEDLKIAFTLREFDGLSYDEIAHVMECPVGTVRSRIFRARESVDSAIQSVFGTRAQ